MEPNLPAPEGGAYERGPLAPRTPEITPQGTPEREQSMERPAPAEQHSIAADNAGVPIQPIQVPQPQQPQPTPASTQVDDNPIVAADEDLIEKEWVDKAKLIIARTKHDPYEQEKEISRLQADYLKKRYGKEIKMSSGE